MSAIIPLKTHYDGVQPKGVREMQESQDDYIDIALGGTGATTAAQARTNLGLGSASTPTFSGLMVPWVRPVSNGVTALQIQESDGTVMMNFDTTNNLITAYSNLRVSNTSPSIDIFDSDATTNNKFWQIWNANGVLKIRKLDDAGSYSIEDAINISTDGKVGFRTASPQTFVHSVFSNNTVYNADMGSDFPTANGLIIENTSTASNAYAGILFSVGTTNRATSFIGLADTDSSTANALKMVFGTRDNGGNIKERMIIDHLGNVGIGGTPEKLLQLTSSDVILSFNQSNASVDNKKWDIRANSEKLAFRAITDNYLSANNWLQVDRTGITIDSVAFPGGYIAVNTVIPMTKGVTISSGEVMDALWVYKGSDADRNWVSWSQGSSLIGWRLGIESGPYNMKLYVGTNYPTASAPGDAVMTWSVTKNVGVGTVSPTAVLHLKAGTATANTAPLKFTSGTNLTASEVGAMEFTGTDFYLTYNGPTRHAIVNDGGTQTLTNKRITKRVVSMADATSVTPTADTADINTHANTQVSGTLTVNAPSGTPTSGQILILRIKSTNSQTYSWNAIYRGSSDLALPASHTGSSKTDYLGFIYNSTDSKWDFMSITKGF